MVKQIIKDTSEDEEVVATKKQLKPKRGKLLSDPKPDGSVRQLLEAPTNDSSPVSVYKERVDNAETGKTETVVWWTTRNSQTIGRDDIVRVNEKTGQEKLLGYDFNVSYNPETKAKLLKEATSYTKFYHKDGDKVDFVANPEKDF